VVICFAAAFSRSYVVLAAVVAALFTFALVTRWPGFLTGVIAGILLIAGVVLIYMGIFRGWFH
jgi:hypothetical protein